MGGGHFESLKEEKMHRSRQFPLRFGGEAVYYVGEMAIFLLGSVAVVRFILQINSW